MTHSKVQRSDKANKPVEHPAGLLSCCAALVGGKEYRIPLKKSPCLSVDVKRKK
jgi:hypothetical protein